MSCPVNKRRAGMTDAEYWEDVAASLQDEPFDGDEPDVGPADEWMNLGQCGVCESTGPCAWDAEGNPMIHAERKAS